MTGSVADRSRRWATEESGFPYEPFELTGTDVARAAALFRSRGVVVLGPPVLDSGLFAQLVAESRLQRDTAAWQLCDTAAPGALPQDNVRAHLGPLARELCAAGATRALLARLTGDVVLPGWSATCLTYYDQAGQYLGAHRDKVNACHYAFLLYLESRWPGGAKPGAGVQLHVNDVDDSGVMLRVTAVPNRLVVLHGSRLQHFRPALGDGEMVGLLAGCYALASA